MSHGYGQRGLKCPPIPKERGPNGRRLCRWCGTEVSGRRVTWCSDACTDAYLARQWPSLTRLVWKRDPGCLICGTTKETRGVKWEVDHILPVADGGTDDPENLRLLCVPCHKGVTAAWRRSRAAGGE